MRDDLKRLPQYRRPEPVPLYGPALLLVLASCSGGGGSSPGQQTTGALVVTSPSGPSTPSQTGPPPEDTNLPPELPRRPDPSGPQLPAPASGQAEFGLPEVRLQPVPENKQIDTQTTLFTVPVRITEDGKTIAASRINFKGKDKALFTVDSATGRVSFKAATTPDYEDVNRPVPEYEVSVTVEYGSKHSVTYNKVIIPILNENEGPAALVLALPSDGRLVAGAVLNASLSGDPDGDAAGADVVWQWQWLSGQIWADLSGNGADTNSYTLQAGDVGRAVRVMASYVDKGGFAEVVTQVIVIPPEVAPPVVRPVPTALDVRIIDQDLAETTDTSAAVKLATLTLTGAPSQIFITGEGAHKFSIVDTADPLVKTLVLKAGEALDQETAPAYVLTLIAAAAPSVTAAFTLTVDDVDEAGSLAALADPYQGLPLFAPMLTDPDDGLRVTGYKWEKSHDGGTAWRTARDGADTLSWTPGEADVGAVIRLTITYEDTHGTKTLTTAVSAPVVDRPDKPPVFTHTAPDPLPEGTKVAATSIIYQAVVSPDVTGDPLTYTLEGADRGLFTISNDGAVTFSSAHTPDYERQAAYHFSVVATVGAGTDRALSAHQLVTVTVTDIDEKPEEIKLSRTSLTLDENTDTSARTELATITLSDDVAGINTLSVDDATHFEIDEGKLWLKAGTVLNFETASSYTVSISVAASGTGDDPAARTFTLTIANLDEAGHIEPLANPVQGTALAVPAITDPDGGVRITGYLWQKSHDGGTRWADLASTSGYTPVQADVGAVLRLIVTYTDLHGTGKTLTTAASAAVADTEDTGRLAAFAGPPVEGTAFAAPAIRDADGGITNIRWQWQKNENDGNGWSDLSGEQAASFTPGQDDVGHRLRVMVTYDDAQGTDRQLTSGPSAAVVDSDNPPSAMQLMPETAALDEGTDTARLLTEIIFTDDTLGRNAVTITRGDKTLFEVRDGNQLWLKDGVGARLDHESGITSYQIELTASTHPGLRQIFTLQLNDIADEKPVPNDPDGVAEIDEGRAYKAGEVIFDAGVVPDVDGMMVSYTLVDKAEDDSRLFQIDADGIVSFSNPHLPDFEVKDSYRFTVQARVEKTVFVTNVLITVNNQDEPPGRIADLAPPVQGQPLAVPAITDPDIPRGEAVSVSHYLWEVSADNGRTWTPLATTEMLTPSQAEVGKLLRLTVWYTDGFGTENRLTTDASATVTDTDDRPTAMHLSQASVSLAEGVTVARKLADIRFTDDTLGANAATAPANDLFEVRNGNQLWLKAGQTLDYETASDREHTITLTATTNPALTADFTLTIRNLNEGAGVITITGTPSPGQQLSAALSADPDGAAATRDVVWQWQWLSGQTWTDLSGNGADTSAYTVQSLNQGRVLRVIARYEDGGGFAEVVTQAVVIPAPPPDVPDAPPTAITITELDSLTALSTAQIAENTATRTELARVRLTDADGGGGSVFITGRGAYLFALEETDNPLIKTLVLRAGQELDYETGQRDFALTLTVAANTAATASFTVTLTNADEGAAALSVTGIYSVGQRLTATLGTDPDGGPSGSVSWQWQWNDQGSWTNIAGAEQQSYLLTAADQARFVRATATYDDDGGKTETVVSAPPVTAVAAVDTGPGAISVSGTARVGYVLTAAFSGDPDGDPDAAALSWQWQWLDGRTWTDLSGNGAGTARYTLQQTDAGRVVRASVSYTDNGGHRVEELGSDAFVIAANQDAVFTLPLPALSLAENADGSGTAVVVGTVQATDADGEAVSYALSGPPAGWQIDSLTGAISYTGTGLDYETTDSVTLHVIATSTGQTGAAVSVRQTVRVAVLDVDEAPTGLVLSRSALRLSEQADTSQRTELAGITIEDDAAGTNILSVDDATHFEIIGNRLYLKAGVRLDHETTDELVVTVSVAGSGTGRQPAAQRFTLSIDNAEEAGTLADWTVVPVQGTAFAAPSVTDLDAGVSAVRYQWQVSDVPTDEGGWTALAGATGAAFTPLQDQVGKYLRVVISYTDDHGTDRSVLTSAASAAVRDTDDAGAIAGLAAPVQGTELGIPAITDADGRVAATGWLWEVSRTGTSGWQTVGTDNSYIPSEDDVGGYLRLTVTYSDAHGTGKTVRTAVSAEVADANDKPPVFTHTAPDALPEATEVSDTTPVYQAVVSPDVAGDPLTYTLEGQIEGCLPSAMTGR